MVGNYVTVDTPHPGQQNHPIEVGPNHLGAVEPKGLLADIAGDGALLSGQPLTVHTTAILLAFGADPRLRDPADNTPWAWPRSTTVSRRSS